MLNIWLQTTYVIGNQSSGCKKTGQVLAIKRLVENNRFFIGNQSFGCEQQLLCWQQSVWLQTPAQLLATTCFVANISWYIGDQTFFAIKSSVISSQLFGCEQQLSH